MRRLPDPSIERSSRRFMLGLPHTAGADRSTTLTRKRVP